MTTTKKPRRQYRDGNDKRLPGVTTVLGVLDKPALVPWAARQAAEATAAAKRQRLDTAREDDRLRRELDELGIQFDALRKRLTAAEKIIDVMRQGGDARELLDAWDTVPGDEKGRP